MGSSDMGQGEKFDSDMGHWPYLKIDMATWPFLKIDMGHGDPPSNAPQVAVSRKYAHVSASNPSLVVPVVVTNEWSISITLLT